VSEVVELDHVAIATDDIDALLATLVGELGGTVMFGGDGYGFRWVQTRLGDVDTGMTVESLVVWRPEVDDFLERFVARHGGGTHHVTFKVPDLPAMLDACRAAGITPVGVRLEDPEWQEAFVQPREAHGTVVQLAQTTDPRPVADELPRVAAEGPHGTPVWWPDPPDRAVRAVALRQVVLGSPDRGATVAFFRDLLQGRVEDEDGTGTVLVWPGGGRIRVEDANGAGIVRLDATGAPARTVTLAGVPLTVG
jgi:methylmalonyl-CoA/ethylmalonyl-CoA epimerase